MTQQEKTDRWFEFAAGTTGLAESRPAGYIQPRRLIAAQGVIAAHLTIQEVWTDSLDRALFKAKDRD